MTKSTLTFIDRASQRLYYLAFDQLLACAPIRDGVAYIDEARTVPSTSDDPVNEAWHAAIRAELLHTWLKDSPAWQQQLREARDTATELARQAGLTESPLIAKTNIVTMALSERTIVPD